jgi:predicted nucleotidyltransferase
MINRLRIKIKCFCQAGICFIFTGLCGGDPAASDIKNTLFFRNRQEKTPSVVIQPELQYIVNMDAAIQAELDKLKELIVDAIPVEQIYLFGSYAYGKPHKDSDLDLFVVLKDDVPMRDLDAGLQIALAIARKKSMPVDIIAKKKKDFVNRLDDITLERKVNRDGIRIYG